MNVSNGEFYEVHVYREDCLGGLATHVYDMARIKLDADDASSIPGAAWHYAGYNDPTQWYTIHGKSIKLRRTQIDFIAEGHEEQVSFYRAALAMAGPSGRLHFASK